MSIGLFLIALGYSGLVVFVLMMIFFLTSLLKKDNSIVDIAWGLGFVLIALLTFLKFGGVGHVSAKGDLVREFAPRQTLVTLLVVIWGLRLSLHVMLRSWGRPEDFRYREWRKKWGNAVVWRSFFQIYLLQGFLMLLVALPIIVINIAGAGNLDGRWPLMQFWQLALVGLWVVGFLFESIGDLQLQYFLWKKRRGKVAKDAILTTGLWRFSRHPNYFGEILMWWSLFGLTIPIATYCGWAWLAIISPILMTFLLLRVSGVPMLEKKFQRNKEFQEYKKRTNAVFPGCPKIK